MVSNEEIDRRATQISGRTPMHTEEPVAIESISSDDKDLTLLSPQPVLVLGKSDINETVNIVADLPAEDVQNVEADLSTGSVVKDKIVEAKLSGQIVVLGKYVAGSDTIIIVKEEPVEPTAPPQEAQDIIISVETKVSTPTEIAIARRFLGLEIMKSIVYGGLIESITSLGVVSSVAAAAALVTDACWAAAAAMLP